MKNLLSLSLLLCSLIWGGCSKDDVPAPSYDADVVIPDEVFRRFCLENYDTDGDGRLPAAEARAVREMYCHDPGIGSMEGIERFTRLEVFDCTYSYGLRGARFERQRKSGVGQLQGLLESVESECFAVRSSAEIELRRV